MQSSDQNVRKSSRTPKKTRRALESSEQPPRKAAKIVRNLEQANKSGEELAKSPKIKQAYDLKETIFESELNKSENPTVVDAETDGQRTDIVGEQAGVYM